MVGSPQSSPCPAPYRLTRTEVIKGDLRRAPGGPAVDAPASAVGDAAES